MLTGIERRYGLRPDQIIMTGDRIYTDIEMAHAAGAFGVLVLSGETTLDVADAAPRQPDLIVENIGVLGELLARGARRALTGAGGGFDCTQPTTMDMKRFFFAAVAACGAWLPRPRGAARRSGPC